MKQLSLFDPEPMNQKPQPTLDELTQLYRSIPKGCIVTQQLERYKQLKEAGRHADAYYIKSEYVIG